LKSDLAQNREELAQLEEEQRSLQHMTDHFRPKTINRFSDYHSVLAEQGTPRNERHCSLEQINPEIDTATVILEHNSEDSPNSRIARIERLLVQGSFFLFLFSILFSNFSIFFFENFSNFSIFS